MGEECTFLHDSISIPRAPRKVCFVVWLTARDAILTTENLRKWKINYVSWCFMCTSAGENVDHHLLLHCGFLSSLLGVGCECEGYGVRIVGHSLGGAIAALLGMKLRKQYPDLHVYTYGALPCVGLVVADACSEFITSIVNNDEFSARLSVASIMRLQAAALKALSEDGTIDITTILKLAHHFTSLSVCQKSMSEGESSVNSFTAMSSCTNQINHSQLENGLTKREPGSSVLHDIVSSDDKIGSPESSNHFSSLCDCSTSDSSPFDDPLNEFLEAVPSSENKSSLSIPELYLPGLVIHIVPQNGGLHKPLWRLWRTWERRSRCQNALENILKTGQLKTPEDASEIV
ncbi:putative V-type proton ATPase subunit e-like [Capsicum annuum]|nr:putative V-type proton ATPase subunit e-like [Capsicum annuum]KAF3673503.1 putative V-type proton ATPase subunit e-like [Capsicum annuum]